MTSGDFQWCHCGIVSFLSFISRFRAMADGRPQRYSVWIGRRNAPLVSAEEIQKLIRENGFKNFETHTRNWDNGGYIVSWSSIMQTFFLFQVYFPSIWCFFFPVLQFSFSIFFQPFRSSKCLKIWIWPGICGPFWTRRTFSWVAIQAQQSRCGARSR